MEDAKSLYLRIGPGDCSPLVVFVGDPGRVERFAEEMPGARVISRAREFVTLSGTFDGVPITVIGVGIGAPSAVLAMEEVWELGAKVVVRAGTVMGIGAPLGNFVLAQGGVRHDGVSRSYLPLEYPAIADADLLFAFREVLSEEEAAFSTGLVASSDAFYTDMYHRPVPGRMSHRGAVKFRQELAERNVIGLDMETSALYAVAHFLGLRCISVLIATVNGLTQEMMAPEPRFLIERQLARVVLKGLWAVNQRLGLA